VNMLTPALFTKYPSVYDLATATLDEISQLIRSCSYPNNKANHLLGMAKGIVEQFEGKVPDNITDLQKLPGVGRKTANVIVSVVYNKPAMAVDTHVFRVSNRIGLTQHAKNPLEAEKQLVKYIPESLVSRAHHWLILHGRYVCLARKPKCETCNISAFCMFYEKKD